MNAQAGRPAVIDTMVASALVNNRRRPRDGNPYSTLIEGRSVIVSFATVTELRFGAISGNWGELRRQDLERNLRTFTIIQPDDKLMMRCAQLRLACEFAGHPLGQKIHEADRWIAATALSGGLDLVSDDKVFVDTPGLSLLTNRRS